MTSVGFESRYRITLMILRRAAHAHAIEMAGEMLLNFCGKRKTFSRGTPVEYLPFHFRFPHLFMRWVNRNQREFRNLFRCHRKDEMIEGLNSADQLYLSLYGAHEGHCQNS